MCFQALHSIVIPSSISKFSAGTFESCYSLIFVWLSKNIDCILESAFAHFNSLRNINIASPVNKISMLLNYVVHWKELPFHHLLLQLNVMYLLTIIIQFTLDSILIGTFFFIIIIRFSFFTHFSLISFSISFKKK